MLMTARRRLTLTGLIWMPWVLALRSMSAQSVAPALSTAAAPLVLRDVTVIDVREGRRLPDQTVVIVGNRIRDIGPVTSVKPPSGAQVVAGTGAYVIPGLWDMHAHTWTKAFLAQGITGIRQPGQVTPIEKLRDDRRAILEGEKIGPRTIFAGPFIEADPTSFYWGMDGLGYMIELGLLRGVDRRIADSLGAALGGWGDDSTVNHKAFAALDSFVIASGRVDSVVASLKAAGADFLKLRTMSARMYYAFAAAARRQGMPFGGHAESESAIDVSDSGASIVDHIQHLFPGTGGLAASCLAPTTARLELCKAIADRFQHNGTWWVPTLAISTDEFTDWWRCHYITSGPKQGYPTTCRANVPGALELSRRVGMPILAGTDDGVSLYAELAVFVAEGLTPLEALQTATLNPAKYLHGTDSLGTVETGKLADLVVLDADPLADIANTQRIRAVVANGRYFDRAALDNLVKD